MFFHSHCKGAPRLSDIGLGAIPAGDLVDHSNPFLLRDRILWPHQHAAECRIRFEPYLDVQAAQ